MIGIHEGVKALTFLKQPYTLWALWKKCLVVQSFFFMRKSACFSQKKIAPKLKNMPLRVKSTWYCVFSGGKSPKLRALVSKILYASSLLVLASSNWGKLVVLFSPRWRDRTDRPRSASSSTGSHTVKKLKNIAITHCKKYVLCMEGKS